MDLTEYEIRASERYRLLKQRRDRHSTGLAGYLTIAGLLMFVSGLVFGGDGETNPMFLAGVGVCTFIGGGGYWLYIRDEERRLGEEMRSIERHFARVGKPL